MSTARFTVLALVLGGCAVAPVPESALPAVTAPVMAAPLPAAETTPLWPSAPPVANEPDEPKAPPVSFAAPPVLLEGSGARIAPADMPVPGYHCHLISPGKRYCHGGMD